MNAIRQVLLSGPCEDESEGDEWTEVKLWKNERTGDDEWAYVVTVGLVDEEPFVEEGFEDLDSALATYRGQSEDIKIQYQERSQDHRQAHVDAIRDAAEDWKGLDAKLAKLVAKLIEKGKARQAIEALSNINGPKS